MKRAILLFALLLTNFLNAFNLKDKLTKGSAGDYVITEQAGTYTVLLIRSLTPRYVILEEIDAPTLNVNADKISWKEWIAADAPGHTAWVSYIIDLEKNKLLESYSHSRTAWLYADDPNNFLPKLLTLSLEKTPHDKRKRVGPPPADDETDHRALWIPSIIYEGKKLSKSDITAWSSRWPQDDSIIAGCEVEVYFSQFPFPYWIEIRSSHYKAAIRTIDSGKDMSSPKALVFQQSPFFLGAPLWKKEAIELHLHCPPYFSQLRLLVMDLTSDSHSLIEMVQISPSASGEVAVQISDKTLHSCLQKGHRYRWVLVPTQFPGLIVYSDTIFEW